MSIADIAKRTGQNYETLRKRIYRQKKSLYKLSTTDYKISKTDTPKNARVLVFSCIHAPFDIPEYLAFLLKQYKKFKCNTVVNLGDERDYHTLSRWDKDPNAMGTSEEADRAKRHLKRYYKYFPKVYCCTSNHVMRPLRLASSIGIPGEFFKSINDINEAPSGWKWADEWEIDNVSYFHGEGFSGENPQITAIKSKHKNTVMGHLHSVAGIQFAASEDKLYWSMVVGCGADNNTYAFNYGKNNRRKPIIGCGIVINGEQPFFIPMNLGSKIEYVKGKK